VSLSRGRGHGCAATALAGTGLAAALAASGVAVLNGPDDYRLEIQTANHVVLGESDRGGAGVEEALQVEFTSTTLKIVIEVSACGVVPPDLDGDCAVGVVDMLGLLGAWGPNPNHPADMDGSGTVDVLDFLALLADATTRLLCEEPWGLNASPSVAASFSSAPPTPHAR
jgi:hypothetical protein